MTTLSYGPDPIQFAELTTPQGTPKGVVVYFHGGFWRAQYDVSLGRPIAAALAAHGWATLNVEYRRNELGGGFPQTFDDVDAAFALLAGTGLEHGVVVAMGHSAGGHLAAWAASRRQQPSESPWSNPAVAATHLITLGAVLDFADAVADGMGEGAVELFMGGAVDERYDLADPARYVPLAVPVWCVHGTADDIVPFSQSEKFVASSVSAGGVAQLVPVEGDHFVVIDVDSASWVTTLEILGTIA
ncbi:alpha/beta hydrolase family protein [Naasia lichenicola]|uniref:Alpha/beta hydrolase n=1 Tax=Naasia lichenicola TaxID=2565933 RepID=A0A4S4FJ13_9MICO|nr:alpha/beta hydrolase [Naasia lichenicola]THG30078.1 alpha/beta hydrolase [Naasia lichenicola]